MLFTPIPPGPPVYIPVIDPGPRQVVALSVYVLAVVLAHQFVTGDLLFMDKEKFSLYGVFSRLFIFLGLVSLPIYSYPTFHQLYYTASGQQDFWLGWTVYNAARFGGVHMPTFMLAFMIALAAWLTPKAAVAIDVATGWAVKKLVEFYQAGRVPVMEEAE